MTRALRHQPREPLQEDQYPREPVVGLAGSGRTNALARAPADASVMVRDHEDALPGRLSPGPFRIPSCLTWPGKQPDEYEEEEQMGTAGNNLVRNVEVKEVVRSLDRFYCYNLAVMHWAEALANCLQGPAAFLLS